MYSYFIIHFTDDKVIWTSELMILPGVTCRYAPHHVKALNELFDKRILHMKCEEMQLGDCHDPALFKLKAISYVYQPDVKLIGADDEQLLH